MSSTLRADPLVELGRFRDAVQFLTRLPVPPARVHDPAWLVRSAKYFPLVGLLVGAVGAGVLLLAGQIWSGALPALLATAATLLLTGALHEDGLADTADSLGGSTREKRLAIMKDSRLGTFGAAALGLTLAAKVTALAALPPAVAAAALLAMHAGGRLAAILVMAALPHATGLGDSRSSHSPDRMSGGEVAAAMLLACPAFWLLGPGLAAAGLAGGGVCALGLAIAARRLFGGYTGDVLGAAEQVFEIGLVLTVSALLEHAWAM